MPGRTIALVLAMCCVLLLIRDFHSKESNGRSWNGPDCLGGSLNNGVGGKNASLATLFGSIESKIRNFKQSQKEPSQSSALDRTYEDPRLSEMSTKERALMKIRKKRAKKREASKRNHDKQKSKLEKYFLSNATSRNSLLPPPTSAPTPPPTSQTAAKIIKDIEDQVDYERRFEKPLKEDLRFYRGDFSEYGDDDEAMEVWNTLSRSLNHEEPGRPTFAPTSSLLDGIRRQGYPVKERWTVSSNSDDTDGSSKSEDYQRNTEDWENASSTTTDAFFPFKRYIKYSYLGHKEKKTYEEKFPGKKMPPPYTTKEEEREFCELKMGELQEFLKRLLVYQDNLLLEHPDSTWNDPTRLLSERKAAAQVISAVRDEITMAERQSRNLENFFKLRNLTEKQGALKPASLSATACKGEDSLFSKYSDLMVEIDEDLEKDFQSGNSERKLEIILMLLDKVSKNLQKASPVQRSGIAEACGLSVGDLSLIGGTGSIFQINGQVVDEKLSGIWFDCGAAMMNHENRTFDAVMVRSRRAKAAGMPRVLNDVAECFVRRKAQNASMTASDESENANDRSDPLNEVKEVCKRMQLRNDKAHGGLAGNNTTNDIEGNDEDNENDVELEAAIQRHGAFDVFRREKVKKFGLDESDEIMYAEEERKVARLRRQKRAVDGDLGFEKDPEGNEIFSANVGKQLWTKRPDDTDMSNICDNEINEIMNVGGDEASKMSTFELSKDMLPKTRRLINAFRTMRACDFCNKAAARRYCFDCVASKYHCLQCDKDIHQGYDLDVIMEGGDVLSLDENNPSSGKGQTNSFGQLDGGASTHKRQDYFQVPFQMSTMDSISKLPTGKWYDLSECLLDADKGTYYVKIAQTPEADKIGLGGKSTRHVKAVFIRVKRVEAWSVSDVFAWATRVGIGRRAKGHIRKKGVNGTELLLLTENKIISQLLVNDRVERKKLIDAITKLKSDMGVLERDRFRFAREGTEANTATSADRGNARFAIDAARESVELEVARRMRNRSWGAVEHRRRLKDMLERMAEMPEIPRVSIQPQMLKPNLTATDGNGHDGEIYGDDDDDDDDEDDDAKVHAANMRRLENDPQNQEKEEKLKAFLEQDDRRKERLQDGQEISSEEGGFEATSGKSESGGGGGDSIMNMAASSNPFFDMMPEDGTFSLFSDKYSNMTIDDRIAIASSKIKLSKKEEAEYDQSLIDEMDLDIARMDVSLDRKIELQKQRMEENALIQNARLNLNDQNVHEDSVAEDDIEIDDPFIGKNGSGVEWGGMDVSQQTTVGTFKTSEKLVQSMYVTVTPHFNFFVSQPPRHRILCIDRGGKVSVFAGSGRKGSNDGAFPHARFNTPSGIAADRFGSIFVCDKENHRIRMIDEYQRAYTLAGTKAGYKDGLCSEARFLEPTGVSHQTRYRLLIADTGNNVIRLINQKSSEVTTIAGMKSAGYRDGELSKAKFKRPSHVVCGRNERAFKDLYVCDSGNEVVRRIDLERNEVTTIGGGMIFSKPSAITIDRSGDNIFVSDTNHHIVRLIQRTASNEKEAEAFAGSGFKGYADGISSKARFSKPIGLCCDFKGRVVVLDSQNHCLRQMVSYGNELVQDDDGNLVPLTAENKDMMENDDLRPSPPKSDFRTLFHEFEGKSGETEKERGLDRSLDDISDDQEWMAQKFIKEARERMNRTYPGPFRPGDLVRFQNMTCACCRLVEGEKGYVKNAVFLNGTKYMVALKGDRRFVFPVYTHQIRLLRKGIGIYFDPNDKANDIDAFGRQQFQEEMERLRNPSKENARYFRAKRTFLQKPWYNKTKSYKLRARMWTQQEVNRMVRTNCKYIPPVKVERFHFINYKNYTERGFYLSELNFTDPNIRRKVEIIDLQPTIDGIRARNRKMNITDAEDYEDDIVGFLSGKNSTKRKSKIKNDKTRDSSSHNDKEYKSTTEKSEKIRFLSHLSSKIKRRRKE